MKKYIAISFLLFALMPLLAKASEDTKLWSSVGHTSYITNNLFLDLEEELRFDDKISNLAQVHFNFGVGWRFNDNFKLSTAYRVRAYDWDYIRNEYLINAYAKYDISNSLEINYRFRYHHKDTYEDHKENKEYLRNKINLSFNWSKKSSPFYNVSKRFTPYIEAEALYRFNYDKASRFDEIRYFVGCKLDLPRKMEIDLAFGYQDERNVNNPKDACVISVGLSLGDYKYKAK